MERQTLASSSSSRSGISDGNNSPPPPPPPEDAWVNSYLKLLPQWQSLTSSNQVFPLPLLSLSFFFCYSIF